jgi:hypothetical protein
VVRSTCLLDQTSTFNDQFEAQLLLLFVSE